jgi:hypothetical protein
MPSHAGSSERRRRGALSDALYGVSIYWVLADLQLQSCLRHTFGCNSAGTSPMHLHVGSSGRRRRCALSNAALRVSIGGVLAELDQIDSLRHSLWYNSARTSSMNLWVGSSGRRSRYAFPDAALRVSIGGVLAELDQIEHLRHPCSCSSASTSPMHSCVGSPERARRHVLPDALHRLSNGAVLVELQLVVCLRCPTGCNSASASSKHSLEGSVGWAR